MFGQKTTSQDIEKMPQALCYTCVTKQRRIRPRNCVDEVTETVVNSATRRSKKQMLSYVVSLHDSDSAESEQIGVALSSVTTIEPKSSEEVSVKSTTESSLNFNSSYEDISSIICDEQSITFSGNTTIEGNSSASCGEEKTQHLSIDATSSSSPVILLTDGGDDTRSMESPSKQKFEAIVCII